MKLYGYFYLIFLRRFGKLYYFLQNLVFFSEKPAFQFLKGNRIHKNTVYIHMYLHTPLVSFCAFPFCLQPSKRSVGGIFDQYFDFFVHKMTYQVRGFSFNEFNRGFSFNEFNSLTSHKMLSLASL